MRALLWKGDCNGLMVVGKRLLMSAAYLKVQWALCSTPYISFTYHTKYQRERLVPMYALGIGAWSGQ